MGDLNTSSNDNNKLVEDDQNAMNLEGHLVTPQPNDFGDMVFALATNNGALCSGGIFKPKSPRKPDKKPTENESSKITSPTKADKKAIENIVGRWDLDRMDPNLRQCTLVEFPRDKELRDWRIDNQKNGAFSKDGMQYYSVAVQKGKGVYANVLVLVNEPVGKKLIQDAFLLSMNKTRVVQIEHEGTNYRMKELP